MQKIDKTFKKYIKAEGCIRITKEKGKDHGSVYIAGERACVAMMYTLLSEKLIKNNVFTVAELQEMAQIANAYGAVDESK